MSGLGLMLQRLRAAVPLHAASAPETPDAAGADGDDGGTTGAGDVESLLAPTNAGRGAGRAGRLPLRALEAYGERRRRFVGRFKVCTRMGMDTACVPVNQSKGRSNSTRSSDS